MFIKNLLISLVLVAGLSSCGEKDDGNGGAGGAPVSDADGTWVTGCTGADSNYTKSTYIIAAGAMTLTTTNYSNAECTGEGTNISVFAGNYTTGAAVTTPAGAKEVTTKCQL